MNVKTTQKDLLASIGGMSYLNLHVLPTCAIKLQHAIWFCLFVVVFVFVCLLVCFFCLFWCFFFLSHHMSLTLKYAMNMIDSKILIWSLNKLSWTLKVKQPHWKPCRTLIFKKKAWPKMVASSGLLLIQGTNIQYGSTVWLISL